MNKTEEKKFDDVISGLGRYIGKWVAIVDNVVVAVGDSGKAVFEEAKKKYPKCEPFIMKVPRNEITIL